MSKFQPESETVFFKLGSEENFKEIFNEFFSSLYYYALRIISDQQVAEDIVQEIFMDLWKKKDEVYINKIANYLYTSVRFKCMNHIRHEKVKNTFSEKTLRENETQVDESIIMIEEEMVKEINKLIDTMPDQRKKVFKLYLDGFSQDEIAKELSISVNTVKTHKLKARQFLRTQLKNTHYLLFLLCFEPFL